MAATGAPFLGKILMGYTAVVRVWTMVEVCFVPCKILLYLLTFVCIEKSVYILFWFVGSYGGSDVGGLYSSSYGGDYMSRGSDVCFYFVNICWKIYCLSDGNCVVPVLLFSDEYSGWLLSLF